MSKAIQNYINKHPEKFDSWHTEMDGYGESYNDHLPSYWVYCKEGYIAPDNECGSIHTKTVKEALALMRSVEKVSVCEERGNELEAAELLAIHAELAAMETI